MPLLMLVFLLLTTHAVMADSYLIMLPTPQTSAYEGQWLRIAHRFNGQLSEDAAEDALGLDYGAQVRLQWDWIRQPGQQFSLSRSSPAGRLELGWRQTWWHQQNLSVYSWHSLTRAAGIADNGPRQSLNHALLSGIEQPDWLWLAGFGYASHTNPGYAGEEDHSLSMMGGGAVRLTGLHWLQLELIKPLQGYEGSNRHPAVTLGWQHDSGLHRFRITLGNARQLDSHWLITSEGIRDSRELVGGFVISRRF